MRSYTSKGKRCKSAPEPASSSSDSDDDDRKDKISHEVYKTAGLDQALHRRYAVYLFLSAHHVSSRMYQARPVLCRLDYVRAVQELTALVRLYSDLPKATQDQVVADAHTAASCCDGSVFFPLSSYPSCRFKAHQAALQDQMEHLCLCDKVPQTEWSLKHSLLSV